MTDSTPSVATLLALYRSMYRMRAFELRIQQVFCSGAMPGFIHLYIGEEAVAAGVCAHLRSDDYVTSTHRGHGHALAKGIPMQELFAEIWGKPTGCNGGRGGSMHIYDLACGFLGTNGIVAAGIPIASGAGAAIQIRGGTQVAVSFFGDGAVNNAAFHEGVNLAAVWSLPVLFVCENNLYATEMPFDKATRNTSVASRGTAYGIPGVEVDGNDAVAVYQAAAEAVVRARAGDGPTLLECKTYRPVGHFEGDPGIGYRTREEIALWQVRDPIGMLQQQLLDAGASGEELDAIRAEVDGEVEQAYEFSKNSPDPDPATFSEFVYATWRPSA